MPSITTLCLKFPLFSTHAISCERSTENDGINKIPFLSVTSFAKSINPCSDSFLGICSVCEYVLSVIRTSISPKSRSALFNNLEPRRLMSPV